MTEDIPACHIRIDKEGNWYYRGLPIIKREIYLHLNKCIRKDPSGKYILLMDGEKCYLEVEDTPYVIKEIRLDADPKRDPVLFVKLNDETEEELKVDTVRVGKDNVLYCKVKDVLFDARFLRASYYQLAEYLQCDGENYYLVVGNKKFYLEQPR